MYLFFCGNGRNLWVRRLASDIDHVTSGTDQRLCLLKAGFNIGISSAVRKRIGRTVKYAHHKSLPADIDLFVTASVNAGVSFILTDHEKIRPPNAAC